MKKIILYLFILLVLTSLVYALVPDDDGDGVPNSEDNCPISTGVVDVFGCDCIQKMDPGCAGDWCCLDEKPCEEYNFRAMCMIDLDNDSVFDVHDRCKDTTPDMFVDSSGCSCSQKVCDDYNLCTDDYCDIEFAKCFFVDNDTNHCGDDQECDQGLCKWDDQQSEFSYWLYDPVKGEIMIFYSHSVHTINVVFKRALEEDVIILDSTSEVISYELSEDRKKLTLLVEGDPETRGVTTIRTMQKPISVKIDSAEISELGGKPSPKSYAWVYISAFLILAALILGFMLSQRKHEDELVSSIKKEEHKIEKEISLEGELQLKMYIITNLRRGYTAQQLRNELLKDGWGKELLDKAFNSLRR